MAKYNFHTKFFILCSFFVNFVYNTIKICRINTFFFKYLWFVSFKLFLLYRRDETVVLKKLHFTGLASNFLFFSTSFHVRILNNLILLKQPLTEKFLIRGINVKINFQLVKTMKHSKNL